MDISEVMLSSGVIRPDVMPEFRGIEKASEQKKKELAKEFEALIINRLLDEMNDSIGSLGLDEDDGSAEQIRGIFNMFLAQHIGRNGGFGLWKQIYEALDRLNKSEGQVQELDNQL